MNWLILVGVHKPYVKRIVEAGLCCAVINETNDSSVEFCSAEKLHVPDKRIYAGGCIQSIDNIK